MGLVELPHIEMYFNTDLAECPILRNCMPYYRFKKIENYLHLSNDDLMPERNTPDFNPLYKARPVLELIKRFSQTCKPGQNLSCDEAILKFTGRSFMKQYMAAKPDKWGFKFWVLADSEFGYVLNCKMYTGKKEERNEDFLLGEKVVLNLCKPYYNLNHCIYFDNFFSSPRLMETLLENGCYACGTVRLNRKGLPEEVRDSKKLKLDPQEVRVY